MPLRSTPLALILPMMVLLTLMAIALINTNIAHAENKPINEAAVLKTIDNVVAEQRVFATCFALEPVGRKVVNDMWVKMVKDARESLASRKPSLKLIAQFEYKTQQRLVDERMTLKDAISYCEKNAEIQKKFYTFGYLDLPTELSALPY